MLSMLQKIALVEVALCWVTWMLAFWGPTKLARSQKKVERAPGSWLGILLNLVGFTCIFVYVRPAGFEKSDAALIAAMLLGPPSVWLTWKAVGHLGKQWRYEAALNYDHELIQTGPYAAIRHPIYLSMLGMLLATGLAWTWAPMFAAGIFFFLIGIEVRIHAEDHLLEMRFQDEFIEYKARVRAYIPFIH
jgi:protein-S-isoprenylcysteine O-methyltransferase Ste14